MERLKALTEVRYDGKTYQPGDVFEASEKHATLFKAIKKAITNPFVPVTQSPPTRTAPIETKVLTPTPEPAPEIQEVQGEHPASSDSTAENPAPTAEPETPPQTGRRRGGYGRRDLRVEE